MRGNRQLISYIAPGAPATRRPATGSEPFLRAEIGFTPKWYRQYLDIDFGMRYHTDPAYRLDCMQQMRQLLHERFPGHNIGRCEEDSLDILTGTYGAVLVAAIYGIPLLYEEDNWPTCEHVRLEDNDVDSLEPPELEENPVFQQLLWQMDWISENLGIVAGYINWQGILNNAQRLRGLQLFTDMFMHPDRTRRLFDCLCRTMINGCKEIQERQRLAGFASDFFTISNCLVNMVSPIQYEEQLLVRDQRLSEEFGLIGVHNCAWSATPYLNAYTQVPNIGYIDMGIISDLKRAKALFPTARRAIQYTPMDLDHKPFEDIKEDIDRIAKEYAPCDIVVADIDAGMLDMKVNALLELCQQYND